MTIEIAKSYEPENLEDKWYKFWKENNFFSPKVDENKKQYCIVIPPPNITGSLHMGHALNNTIQDILSRYKRMKGFDTLWLPGTDHAGIATQNVVERKLLQDNIKREDLGREKFVEKVWEWKEEYGNRIVEQLEKLGCSCDWSRLRFTLDEGLSNAVKEVFIKLYEEGLIYKGNYIINWCPRCKTALADDEATHKDINGKFYYIKYFFKDEPGKYLVIATTRPETMLGDTAVAVHPEDERYAGFENKKMILPLVNREIPLIKDNYVDPSFGTGVLKITPAHDPNDFLIGKKHGLEEINILNEDATINETCGKYSGLDRFEAREKVVQDLKKQDYLVKTEDYQHPVGHCYRCGTMVEPYISKQWFVKMKPLVAEAIKAVKAGRTVFHPKQWAGTYFDWLENVRDWCISRQLWWGHRIPVWYCDDCENVIVSKEEITECDKCKSKSVRQDEDVLDTWFSSALWPFSTLGWPEKTKELSLFYPTSVLVTAFDIIFFWVARMMIMGLHFRKEVPFHEVYIHGLIRTSEGYKMSKSSGNIIDPLDLIKDYGCDAMRFTLSALLAQGRDIKLSEERLEGYRHFVNKVWNAARFILMNIKEEDIEYINTDINPDKLALADKWLLHNMSKTVLTLEDHINAYRFNDAANLLYSFVWHKFCDWYIEISKPELYSEDREKRRGTMSLLLNSMVNILKMLHPFMPFITEELWHFLPEKFRNNNSIMISDWPDLNYVFKEEDRNMNCITDIVAGIRNIRSQMTISPDKKIEVDIEITEPDIFNIVNENKCYIELLARLKRIDIHDKLEKPENTAVTVIPDITVYVHLKGLIDYDLEKKRLRKKLDNIINSIEKIETNFKNEKFMANAPKKIIEKEKKRLIELKSTKEKITANLESINSM